MLVSIVKLGVIKQQRRTDVKQRKGEAHAFTFVSIQGRQPSVAAFTDFKEIVS